MAFATFTKPALLSMTDNRATVVALLIAPIIPAALFALYSPGLGGGFDADVPTLAMLTVLGYFYSLVAVGLLGLPAFMILHRFRFDNLAATITSGVLIGLLISFVIAPPALHLSTLDWLLQSRVMTLIGGATALAFRAVRKFALRARLR